MTLHVPPQWPTTTPCKIAFVGEAPGADEIAATPPCPFVGPAGRVFNVILRSANIDRSECLVTNFFDQKAPGNDVGPWMRDPGRVAEATARLAAELAHAQPNVIVPLGGPALWAFTGHMKITDFRGSVMEADRVVPGAKLLPTFHPMAVQHKWTLLSLVVQDFVKAAREGDLGPQIVWPKRKLLLCPDVADVDTFLSGPCMSSDLLSVDIETGWGCITCIGFAPSAEIAMCIPFVDLRKPNKSYWGSLKDELLVWNAVKLILQNPTVPKLGQNFPYDAFWLADYGIEVRNYLHDTRLLHHALYPELPKTLASMAASYTDLVCWKSWAGHKVEKRDA